MAHKTLIGGTAYEIKGGRDLIGGTGYAKKSGKSMINGTAYDIKFGPDGYVISFSGATAAAYIKYGDITYGYGAVSPIVVQPGDKITVWAMSTDYYFNPSTIYHNGTLVAKSSKETGYPYPAEYAFSPTGNTSISFIRGQSDDHNTVYYTVYITDES